MTNMWNCQPWIKFWFICCNSFLIAIKVMTELLDVTKRSLKFRVSNKKKSQQRNIYEYRQTYAFKQMSVTTIQKSWRIHFRDWFLHDSTKTSYSIKHHQCTNGSSLYAINFHFVICRANQCRCNENQPCSRNRWTANVSTSTIPACS